MLFFRFHSYIGNLCFLNFFLISNFVNLSKNQLFGLLFFIIFSLHIIDFFYFLFCLRSLHFGFFVFFFLPSFLTEKLTDFLSFSNIYMHPPGFYVVFSLSFIWICFLISIGISSLIHVFSEACCKISNMGEDEFFSYFSVTV